MTHAKHHTTRTAQPAAAHVEFASVTTATSATAPSARTFETPKVAAPILVTPSPRANPRALKAVTAARSRSHGVTGTPPGQTVKVLAQTPQALRTGPPGLVAKATRAVMPGSSASTPAATHSQKTTKQATGKSQSQSQGQSQSQRTTPSHPATAQNDEAKAKAKPEHPATPPHRRDAGRRRPRSPGPPETRGKKP